MTKYQFIIQIIVTDRTLGTALAVALGGPGDIETFSDDYAMLLTKDGADSWGTEAVVTRNEYDIACDFRDGINPPALGLPDTQFNATRSVSLIRCGGREIQYTLAAFAELNGFEPRKEG